MSGEISRFRAAGMAPAVALAGLVAAAAGAGGARFGLLPPYPGFALFAAGLLLGGLLALILGAFALKAAGGRRDGRGTALLGMLLGAGMLVVAVSLAAPGLSLPPIHDLTTDPADPPAYSEATRHPDNRGRDLSYPHGPADTAELQRRAYPELATVSLALPVDEAYDLARRVADEMDWRITWASAARGVIEAYDVSATFRFVDDVVVRVAAAGAGSEVDVRSTSRVGRSDLGANAQRIRRYTSALRRAAGEAVRPPAGEVAQWQIDWADGAVFYEIFVRSFADSDGDGVGDLRGLTARLDYLNDGDPATTEDLGVTGLWLMPIFASPSYHGYDTLDYDAINPDYGTLEDFQTFLEAAHRRGIRVILDLMINHTGVDHPWFVESASGEDSPRRDWYVWRDDDPGWKQPWGSRTYPTWHEKDGSFYYGIFWSGMPDLNFRNPEVGAEVQRIALAWLERGVDGFRLDAARHIVADGPGALQNDTLETHAFWRDFAATVRGEYPQALLVGENWTSSEVIATYYGSTAAVERGDELPMSFNFPLASAIVDAVRRGEAGPVAAALAAKAQHYPPGVLDATFLTNHDMLRLATELEGEARKLASAAAVLLTLPGTPFLYYGEEVGLANGPPAEGDPAKRTPMPWSDEPGGGFTTGEPWAPFAPGRERANVAAQQGDPASLLSHYRRWIGQRNASPALARGSLELLAGSGPALVFVRQGDGGRLLVAHNLGGEAVTAGPFALPPPGTPLPASDPAAVALHDAEAGVTLQLPPGASAAWRLAMP